MKFDLGLGRLISGGVLGALMAATPVLAADYPTKPIELIVPYAAGGGTDLVARAFADAAKANLPQSIGVVNKTGGGGAVGLTEIMAARPNGYKIGMGTVEITMLPHMGAAAFKAENFTPIARLNAEPSAITVGVDAPWNTIEEFMEHAKANPDAVRVGNSGTGAIWHIAAEALGQVADVKFNNVPFEGANPAVTSLLGGHIEAVSVSPAEVSSHVAAGKLKILAVMADERSPRYPDVPTVKEKGYDVAVSTWRGIVVPKSTPEEIVTTLREAARKTAAEPAFLETLNKMNLTAAYLDGPEFGEVITKDDAFFADMMGKLGLSN